MFAPRRRAPRRTSARIRASAGWLILISYPLSGRRTPGRSATRTRSPPAASCRLESHRAERRPRPSAPRSRRTLAARARRPASKRCPASAARSAADPVKVGDEQPGSGWNMAVRGSVGKKSAATSSRLSANWPRAAIANRRSRCRPAPVASLLAMVATPRRASWPIMTDRTGGHAPLDRVRRSSSSEATAESAVASMTRSSSGWRRTIGEHHGLGGPDDRSDRLIGADPVQPGGQRQRLRDADVSVGVGLADQDAGRDDVIVDGADLRGAGANTELDYRAAERATAQDQHPPAADPFGRAVHVPPDGDLGTSLHHPHPGCLRLRDPAGQELAGGRRVWPDRRRRHRHR